MNTPEAPANGVRIVDDVDAEAARILAERGGQPVRIPSDPPPPGETQSEVVTGLAAALGREVYTWTSPYNSAVVVRFRRPRAGTDELVARLLGDQSDNNTLTRRHKALLSVIEIDGKPYSSERVTDAKLRILRDRIGFVGPEEDDVFDEPVNTFVTAYEMAMYPEQISAISEAQGIGLSPADIARIAKATGLERPKA